MKQVFADTSFYLALLGPADQLNQPAMAFTRNYRGVIVTTEYILLEVGNSLSRYSDRMAFVTFLKTITADPQTIIVWSNDSLFQEGSELFGQRVDKEWSLTDCLSFVVMNQRKINEALTGDHHFEQAGFRVLLK